MDLTEFLLARLAEDEAVARQATPGGWSGSVSAGDAVFAGIGRRPVAVTGSPGTDETAWNADHIARHDPARVLAECEAKRRIVSRALTLDEQSRTMPGNGTLHASFEGQALAYRVALRFLAQIYAAHPDYDPAWAV